MKHFRDVAFAALLVTAIGAVPAFAHTGQGHVSGIVAGLSHPIGGLDHVLAMLAVGIWSALASGDRHWRMWVAPVVFVAAMLVGAGAGYLQLPLPMVETGIALSVLVLGLMIVARIELPLAVGVLVITAFAVYHGHAHGAEATGAIVAYMTGFAIATAALHVAGIGLGLVMTRVRLAAIGAGALISAAGAYMLTA